MSNMRLLLAEMSYRRINFGLSLLAVVIAAGLFVAGPTLVDGYSRQTDVIVGELEEQTAAHLAEMQEQTDAELGQMKSETESELARMEDETRKLMIKMGFNLMIVHRDTDMTDFLSPEFGGVDMPQEYVARLASAKELTLVTHLVATLQKRIEWEGRHVLLIGYLQETPQSHMSPKTPMGFQIEPGSVYLGSLLGRERSVGDTIEVLGREFTIGQILPEDEPIKDITIAMNLSDAQEILDKPGKINQIMALGCRCEGERLPQIRSQLEGVLPESKITEFRSIAVARAEQRDMVAARRAQILDQEAVRHAKILADARASQEAIVENTRQSRGQIQSWMESMSAVVTPVVVLACAVWVGLLAMANVRERRAEIGVLRALGKRSANIAGLFLGKAVILGLLGGVLGFGLGTLIARLGAGALEVDPRSFTPAYSMLVWAAVGGPMLAAMASYLPAMMAIRQDPAIVLSDQ